jgi:hypothetical protein
MIGIIQYGLIFAGLSSIALGVFHIPRIWGTVFPQWNTEINGISLLSRKLINTVLMALCLTVVILGSITLFIAVENSDFDRLQVRFLFFCFLFWLWRTIWQILYFPYRKLKPGPKLLSLHIVMIIIFVANTMAYLVPIIATFVI